MADILSLQALSPVCLKYALPFPRCNWLANISFPLDSGHVCPHKGRNACQIVLACDVLIVLLRYPLDVVKTRV